MAFCTKHVSLSLFLFLSFSLFFTNASAGRYFFSKVTRKEKAENLTEAIPESSIPEEKKSSEKFPRSSQGAGYGLYGRGPEQFSPTTTATVDNAERIANEKLFNRNGREEYKNSFDNTNDDPYKFSTEFTEGRYRPNYDQRNKQFQYGMSDTRFMENGRYYYDVNGRRNGFGSESGSNPMRTNPEEYRSYGSYGRGGGSVGRYRNEGDGNENRNEYGKNLNQNENKGENDWSQEEYIP